MKLRSSSESFLNVKDQINNKKKKRDNNIRITKKTSIIPVIIQDERDQPQHDVFFDEPGEYDQDLENGQGRNDKPLSSCDVPKLWKKDMRDRRTSINSVFLSPNHMDRLNKKHRKDSLNPEGFEELRLLSAQLQDQRRSVASSIGDSDFSGSQSPFSDDDDDEDDDVIVNIAEMNLSPKSNVLLERSRRLSSTGEPPQFNQNPKTTTKKTTKEDKSSMKSRRMSVDNFLSPNNNNYSNSNKRNTTKKQRRISMITKSSSSSKNTTTTIFPKIESGYIVNQPQQDYPIKNYQQRKFSLSPVSPAPPSPNEQSDSALNKQRDLPVVKGHLVRRASRIISKVEQSLIEKELDFLGNQSVEKDPLDELRQCRYLRHVYNPNHSDVCPCNTCERNRCSAAAAAATDLS